MLKLLLFSCEKIKKCKTQKNPLLEMLFTISALSAALVENVRYRTIKEFANFFLCLVLFRGRIEAGSGFRVEFGLCMA
jgi:hypothetical protein